MRDILSVKGIVHINQTQFIHTNPGTPPYQQRLINMGTTLFAGASQKGDRLIGSPLSRLGSRPEGPAPWLRAATLRRARRSWGGLVPVELKHL